MSHDLFGAIHMRAWSNIQVKIKLTS
uniref:Uncharacterized protein n=1 Tax=Anguilla anguilla TaxID=7936 RepID=A0A0E9RM12_ANGAN